MTRPMMEEERSHMTERILNLTLEIIYLLTGENFPPLKSGDHVTITVPPCDFLKPERPDMEKIVEATKKMMELLTGESGIVKNSKLDVKKDIKVEDDERSMMEASSSPRPLDSTQEDHNYAQHDQSENLEDGHLVVKEENIEEDEEYGGAKERSEGHTMEVMMEPPNHRNPPQRCPRPLEDLPIPRHHQSEDLIDIKVEVKSEETKVREDQRSTEEAGVMRTSIEEAGMMRISIKEAGVMRTSIEEAGVVRDGDVAAVHTHSHKCRESFSCPDCGECFVKLSDLHRYQTSASAKKLYSCAECGKCFSQKSELSLHERIHTGEKPYMCSECGKRFARKHYLKAHGRIHTGEKPHPCSECGKRFATKYNLSLHQTSHTGDKPYSCSECDKRFALKSQLVIHHRSHTGERPYSCEECGNCYSRLGHFHAHQRSHKRKKLFSA